jgi:UDP-galactose transporter B1
MYMVSYPFVMMAKACGLISAILVGVFCSRVRNKELKLGPQKIIIGLIVTIGIIAFRVFDPTANFNDNRSVQLLGLFLLLVSLLADGFIPDFNAEVKDIYNPPPIQMLCIVNKWCALFSIIYLTATLQAKNYAVFCIQHHEYLGDMLVMTVLSFIGQIFIYRMVKTFKQHIVPFVISTRRIITVAVSMVYYHHRTNAGQVVSIVVVFGVTVYEFYSNITKTEPVQQIEEK